MNIALKTHRQDAGFGPTGYGQKPVRIRSNREKIFSSWRAERFARFMKDRFPRATEQHLASLTGLPADTVRKHLNGSCKPGGEAVLAYLAVFGPELLAAMMPACDWAERAAHDEARRQIRAQLERIGERI